jgi:hypothetical protein
MVYRRALYEPDIWSHIVHIHRIADLNYDLLREGHWHRRRRRNWTEHSHHNGESYPFCGLNHSVVAENRFGSVDHAYSQSLRRHHCILLSMVQWSDYGVPCSRGHNGRNFINLFSFSGFNHNLLLQGHRLGLLAIICLLRG